MGEEKKKERLIDQQHPIVKEMYDKKWYGKNRTRIQRSHPRGAKFPKYKKKQCVRVLDGFDILENQIVVRPYIQKKYKITLALLELLLYL